MSSLSWHQRAAEWSEAGISVDDARRATRQRAQRAKRTRCATSSAFALAALSVFLRLVFVAVQARAVKLAAHAGEPCGPLLGRWVDAVVYENRTLWRPRYVPDANARHLLRVHETSTLCPTLTTRVRQKFVNVTSAFAPPVAAKDAGAICLQHFVDAFTQRKC